MLPGEKLAHELGRDGVGLDELGQQTLPEEVHQQGAVPLRQGLPRAVRRLGAVGREQVHVGMPLDEIAGGGDGDDDAGSAVVAEFLRASSVVASAAARPSSVSSPQRRNSRNTLSTTGRSGP